MALAPFLAPLPVGDASGSTAEKLGGSQDAGWVILRVAIVEAKHLVVPDGHACRPYVACRIGSQHGQTRVASGFRWGNEKNGGACEWRQHFDFIVHRHDDPRRRHFEDVLALRVLSFQMTRKDITLGKVDLAVHSLGDPLNPPLVDVLPIPPAGVPRATAPGTSVGSSTGPNLSDSLSDLESASLPALVAQDFWVPLSTSAPHAPWSHLGELRLRVTIEAVNPTVKSSVGFYPPPWDLHRHMSGSVDVADESDEARSFCSGVIRKALQRRWNTETRGISSGGFLVERRFDWHVSPERSPDQLQREQYQVLRDAEAFYQWLPLLREDLLTNPLPFGQWKGRPVEGLLDPANLRKAILSGVPDRVPLALLSWKHHLAPLVAPLDQEDDASAADEIPIEQTASPEAEAEAEAETCPEQELEEQGAPNALGFEAEDPMALLARLRVRIAESRVANESALVHYALYRIHVTVAPLPQTPASTATAAEPTAKTATGAAAEVPEQESQAASTLPQRIQGRRRPREMIGQSPGGSLPAAGEPEVDRLAAAAEAVDQDGCCWHVLRRFSEFEALFAHTRLSRKAGSWRQRGRGSQGSQSELFKARQDTSPGLAGNGPGPATATPAPQVTRMPSPPLPQPSGLAGNGLATPPMAPGAASDERLPQPRRASTPPRIRSGPVEPVNPDDDPPRVKSMKNGAVQTRSLNELNIERRPVLSRASSEGPDRDALVQPRDRAATLGDDPEGGSGSSQDGEPTEDQLDQPWSPPTETSAEEQAKLRSLLQLTLNPVKSLRSVLVVTMTPEFLEERRMALERAIRLLVASCRKVLTASQSGSSALHMPGSPLSPSSNESNGSAVSSGSKGPAAVTVDAGGDSPERLSDSNLDDDLPVARWLQPEDAIEGLMDEQGFVVLESPSTKEGGDAGTEGGEGKERKVMIESGEDSDEAEEAAVPPELCLARESAVLLLHFLGIPLPSNLPPALHSPQSQPQAQSQHPSAGNSQAAEQTGDQAAGEDEEGSEVGAEPRALGWRRNPTMADMEQEGLVSPLRSFRVFVWMLMGGAAHRVYNRLFHMSKDLPYEDLSTVESEADWNRLRAAQIGARGEAYVNLAPCFHQIELDVMRTKVLPGSREDPCLRRLLRAFVMARPKIGYCQAMNYVGLFLLRMTRYVEREAFLLLLSLADDVVAGYWVPSMIATQADMKVLSELVAAAMPDLHKHLATMNLPLELFSSQWLLSLFTSALPPLTVMRVWDWLFLEGPVVLLGVTMAILRKASARLLVLDDLQQCSDCLTVTARNFVDSDALISGAHSELVKLQLKYGNDVRSIRDRRLKEVRATIRARDEKKRHKRRSVEDLVRLTETVSQASLADQTLQAKLGKPSLAAPSGGKQEQDEADPFTGGTGEEARRSSVDEEVAAAMGVVADWDKNFAQQDRPTFRVTGAEAVIQQINDNARDLADTNRRASAGGSKSDAAPLERCYRSMSDPKNVLMNWDQFHQVMEPVRDVHEGGDERHEETLKKIFAAFKHRSSGTELVDWGEFICTWATLVRLPPADKLAILFVVTDRQKRGAVDRSDVTILLNVTSELFSAESVSKLAPLTPLVVLDQLFPPPTSMSAEAEAARVRHLSKPDFIHRIRQDKALMDFFQLHEGSGSPLLTARGSPIPRDSDVVLDDDHASSFQLPAAASNMSSLADLSSGVPIPFFPGEDRTSSPPNRESPRLSPSDASLTSLASASTARSESTSVDGAVLRWTGRRSPPQLGAFTSSPVRPRERAPTGRDEEMP